MQPIARDGLTADQVRAIVGASVLEVEAGCDLLDTDNVYVGDISEHLVPGGSQVKRNSYATIHGTCKLGLSTELDWGKDRVRPWMRLTSPSGSFRVDLGVYLLSTPDTTAGEDPRTWQVEGYDLLEVLNHPHGQTFTASAGEAYLDVVTDLVEAFGLEVSLSSKAEGKLLPRDRVWPIDPDTSTLEIVNDLLGAAGYRGIYARWDGVLRSEPYQSPTDRPSEWVYDTADPRTIVGPLRTLTADFFDAANRLVAILDDPEAGEPTEGDGLYTLTNQSDGRTSIDARGRTISRVELLDAADQEALETQADQIFEEEKRVTEELTDLTVGPNPLHWHMDVARVVDPDLFFDRKCLVRSWSLPLDGSDGKVSVRSV